MNRPRYIGIFTALRDQRLRFEIRRARFGNWKTWERLRAKATRRAGRYQKDAKRYIQIWRPCWRTTRSLALGAPKDAAR